MTMKTTSLILFLAPIMFGNKGDRQLRENSFCCAQSSIQRQCCQPEYRGAHAANVFIVRAQTRRCVTRIPPSRGV